MRTESLSMYASSYRTFIVRPSVFNISARPWRLLSTATQAFADNFDTTNWKRLYVPVCWTHIWETGCVDSNPWTYIGFNAAISVQYRTIDGCSVLGSLAPLTARQTLEIKDIAKRENFKMCFVENFIQNCYWCRLYFYCTMVNSAVYFLI